MISNIHIFSGEEQAAEVENNTESLYSDVTPQTNQATLLAGVGYHHKAVSLSCQFCALKVTSGHKTLALHYASQHRDKLWACKECSYLALSKKSLAKHRNIHRKYPCNECDYAATRAQDLKRHKESSHEGIRYPCNYCDFSAIRESDLKRHKESKHENVIYSCSKCDYAATTARSLTRHKESKHGGIRYPCSVCDFAATRRDNLKNHMESKHKGV